MTNSLNYGKRCCSCGKKGKSVKIFEIKGTAVQTSKRRLGKRVAQASSAENKAKKPKTAENLIISRR